MNDKKKHEGNVINICLFVNGIIDLFQFYFSVCFNITALFLQIISFKYL